MRSNLQRPTSIESGTAGSALGYSFADVSPAFLGGWTLQVYRVLHPVPTLEEAAS